MEKQLIELTWQGTALENQALVLSTLLEIIQECRQIAEIPGAKEGCELLLKQVSRLQAETWGDPKYWNHDLMHKKAVTLAATALRFMLDVCMEGKKP